MVLIEGLFAVGHVGVVLPGLRDHHHEGMGEGEAAEDQIFKDIVKIPGVGKVLAANRPYFLEFFRTKDAGFQQALLGFPPVQVTSNGIDFPVVGDVAEGLRQFPLRYRVRRKTGVDQGDSGGHTLILEVGVKGAQLISGELAFIDDRFIGKGSDIELCP